MYFELGMLFMRSLIISISYQYNNFCIGCTMMYVSLPTVCSHFKPKRRNHVSTDSVYGSKHDIFWVDYFEVSWILGCLLIWLLLLSFSIRFNNYFYFQVLPLMEDWEMHGVNPFRKIHRLFFNYAVLIISPWLSSVVIWQMHLHVCHAVFLSLL